MQSRCTRTVGFEQRIRSDLQRYRGRQETVVGTCRPTDFGPSMLAPGAATGRCVFRFIEVNHGRMGPTQESSRDLKANCETVDARSPRYWKTFGRPLDCSKTRFSGVGREFGRPGLVPEDGKDETGTQLQWVTFWLAGGGVKTGHVHGKDQ